MAAEKVPNALTLSGKLRSAIPTHATSWTAQKEGSRFGDRGSEFNGFNFPSSPSQDLISKASVGYFAP